MTTAQLQNWIKSSLLDAMQAELHPPFYLQRQIISTHALVLPFSTY